MCCGATKPECRNCWTGMLWKSSVLKNGNRGSACYDYRVCASQQKIPHDATKIVHSETEAWSCQINQLIRKIWHPNTSCKAECPSFSLLFSNAMKTCFILIVSFPSSQKKNGMVTISSDSTPFSERILLRSKWRMPPHPPPPVMYLHSFMGCLTSFVPARIIFNWTAGISTLAFFKLRNSHSL